MHLGKIILSIVMVAWLSACGSSSGSGDSKDNGDSTNNTPTVNAGIDKNIKVDESIIITGTANDSDGTIVGYEWKEGNKFLANMAVFDYLPIDVGIHTLTLTVTDNDGATVSDSVVVTVIRSLENSNTLPIVTPIPILTPIPTSSPTLTVTPTPTVTPIPTPSPTLTVTLTPTVTPIPTPSPTLIVEINKAPIVNAGENKTATINQAITIIGTASDTDGIIVSYEWKKGNEVLATTASFSYIPTVVGDDTLTLTVTDNDGTMSSDSVVVMVTENISTISKGLVAHYKFEGNVNDSSGNENHATEYGEVAYIDGVIGSFDGSSYLNISDVNDFSFDNEFTITSFLKPKKPDNSWVVLLTKGTDMYSAYGIVYYCNNICVPYIRFTDNNDKQVEFKLSNKNSLNLNKYNFISWVFKNNSLKIYLDGNLIYNQNIGISSLKQDITQELEIGRDLPGDTEFFNGNIDDLRIYNRALNESEIQELYNLQ